MDEENWSEAWGWSFAAHSCTPPSLRNGRDILRPRLLRAFQRIWWTWSRTDGLTHRNDERFCWDLDRQLSIAYHIYICILYIYIFLYWIILYYITLFYYYIILYYIILYYIILYYILILQKMCMEMMWLDQNILKKWLCSVGNCRRVVPNFDPYARLSKKMLIQVWLLPHWNGHSDLS